MTRHTHKGRPSEDASRDWSDVTRSQGTSRISRQPLAARRGKRESSARVSGESGTMWHLDFGPLASSTVRECVAVGGSRLLWGPSLPLSHKFTSFCLSSNSHQTPGLLLRTRAPSTLPAFFKEEVPTQGLPSRGLSPSRLLIQDPRSSGSLCKRALKSPPEADSLQPHHHP